MTTKELYIACSDPSCCDILIQPTDLPTTCNTALFRTTGSYMSCPNPPLPVTMYQFPHLAHFFYPDNGDSRFLKNISNQLSSYTSHPQQTVRLHETVFAILRTSNSTGKNIWSLMFIMSGSHECSWTFLVMLQLHMGMLLHATADTMNHYLNATTDVHIHTCMHPHPQTP